MYTEQDLLDKAYSIATANNLVESFNYKEFQNIQCTDYAWEPFEYWPEDNYRSHINSSAKAIFNLLKEVQNNVLSNQ